MSKPKPPADLDAAGVALWTDVVAKYDLRVDELRVLSDAAHAADRVASMRLLMQSEPLLTTGSTRQLVVHPLVAEIRAHEAQIATLMTRLKLPDEAGGSQEQPRSTQARSAAQSRWASAHGAGA